MCQKILLDLLLRGGGPMKEDIQKIEEPYGQRRATVRAGIIRRIRPTCPHLPEDEFLALVDQMVDRQLDFEVKRISFRRQS